MEAVLRQLPFVDLEQFTLEKWLWAHGIVLTRALPFGNELSLIPGLDFANHELGCKNACSIGVKGSDGEVQEAPARGTFQLGSHGRRMSYTPVFFAAFHATYDFLGQFQATDAKQLEDQEPEAVLTAGLEHGVGDQVFIDYALWRNASRPKQPSAVSCLFHHP